MSINTNLAYLTARSAQVGSNESSRIQRLTESGGDRFILAFDDSTDTEAIWTIPYFPAAYQTGTLTLLVDCIMASATTGNIVLQAQVEAVTAADAVNLGTTTSFDTMNSSTVAVAGTAGYLFQATITLTNKDSLAVGDYVRIRLIRQGTSVSDTATGDLRILGASLYEAVTSWDASGYATVTAANLTATGILTAGSTPTTLTDSTGKVLSAALNTVAVAQGGTGQTSYTNGQLLIGNTTGNTLTKATLTGTTNQVVVTNSTGSITLSTPQNINTTSSPTFVGVTATGVITAGTGPTTLTDAAGKVLSAALNTVAVAQGGTGQTSYTNGQLLIGNTSGNTLAKANLTGTTNQVVVTNGASSITLSTPQDIDTTSSPTFTNENLTGWENVGSSSAPGNTTAGDLTFVRGFATTSIAIGSTTPATHAVDITGAICNTTYARVGSLTSPTNTTAGDLQAVRMFATTSIAVGSTTVPTHALDVTGGVNATGALRAGSLSDLSGMTTAGDITGLRLSLGGTAVSAAAGEAACIRGTMVDVTGTPVLMGLQATISPSSTTTTLAPRTFSISAIYSTAQNVGTSNIVNVGCGVYAENRIVDCGTVVELHGVKGIGMFLNGSTASLGATTTVAGGYFQGLASASVPVGVTPTIASSFGIKVGTSTVSSVTLTGQAGVAVGVLSGATNNTSILIGATSFAIPTGDWSIYSATANASSFAGKISIGANVTPTNDLSFDGQAARTIWSERHTTTNTTGNNLTLQSGGAKSGATDTSSGTLILSPGASTGTGRGTINLKGYTTAASTGTADNTQIDREIIGAFKALTNNSATTMLTAAVAALSSAAGIIRYAVEVTNGTDTQIESGVVSYAASNKAGTITTAVTKSTTTNQCTSGTLTCTFTLTTASSPVSIQLNANSSLTPSTGYPRITYSVENFTQQAIAIS